MENKHQIHQSTHHTQQSISYHQCSLVYSACASITHISNTLEKFPRFPDPQVKPTWWSLQLPANRCYAYNFQCLWNDTEQSFHQAPGPQWSPLRESIRIPFFETYRRSTIILHYSLARSISSSISRSKPPIASGINPYSLSSRVLVSTLPFPPWLRVFFNVILWLLLSMVLIPTLFSRLTHYLPKFYLLFFLIKRE